MPSTELGAITSFYPQSWAKFYISILQVRILRLTEPKCYQTNPDKNRAMTKILVHLTLGPTSISPRSNEGNSLFNIYPFLEKKSTRYHDSQLTRKALIPCWRPPESTCQSQVPLIAKPLTLSLANRLLPIKPYAMISQS